MRSFLFLMVALFLSSCGSSYYAGLGSYSPGINQGTTQADGATGRLMPLNYPLTLRIQSSGSGLHLHSAIDSSILYPRSGPEGEVKNTYYLLRSIMSYHLTSSPRISIGLGPVFSGHQVSGSGTIVSLPNGNSTANFATPGYSRSSWILGVDAMLGIEVGSFLLSTEVIVQGFASTQKRNYAGLLALAYKFGDQ